MVSTFSLKRLILPLAPVSGAVIGLAASAVVALIPGDLLDRIILRSGLPAILAAAEPPLGFTARLVLGLLGGASIGVLAWFALFLIVGSRTIALGGEPVDEDGDPVPVLRRADAHPDAPSRRPVFANRDLGTPFLEVRAAQTAGPDQFDEDSQVEHRPMPLSAAPVAIPDDLDLPLSAFDPAAMRAAIGQDQDLSGSAAAIDESAFQRHLFEPGERLEAFALPRVPQAVNPAPLPEHRREPRDTEATINALLERLERGVSDRAGRLPSLKQPDRLAPSPRPQPPKGLEQTLGTLRRMAMRG